MTTPSTSHLRGVPSYDRDNLPFSGWAQYRKRIPTKMVRLSGPFACRTLDGNYVICEDGWLAVDSQGHPYPIAAAEHDAAYESVEDEAE